MSELVKRHIEDAGLSQKAAAKRLGVSEAYLSDVLNKRRLVSVALAVKMERIFNVNAEDLLYPQMLQQIHEQRLATWGSKR